MEFTRSLRKGMHGADVRYIKDLLFSLGSFSKNVTAITTDVFDHDTWRAVLAFQFTHRDANGRFIFPDGVVGPKTWAAIASAYKDDDDSADDGIEMPANISAAKAAAIKAALLSVSELRQSIVLTALAYAYDPDVPAAYPHSLYIRAANLYTTALKPYVITAERIESGAKKQPEYYDGGRKEMMLKAVAANPHITGADCSGAVVGILRYFGLVEPGFDQTADSLSSSKFSAARDKAALVPGDWVGRSEHIGFYVGAGFVAEWMGGAYGCQLSMLDARKGWSFTEKKSKAQSPFTRYRKPIYY